jgi:hypothetical protein
MVRVLLAFPLLDVQILNPLENEEVPVLYLHLGGGVRIILLDTYDDPSMAYDAANRVPDPSWKWHLQVEMGLPQNLDVQKTMIDWEDVQEDHCYGNDLQEVHRSHDADAHQYLPYT